jgi:hypothetical protein
MVLTVRMYLRSTSTQVEKLLLHVGGRPGKYFFKLTGNAVISAVRVLEISRNYGDCIHSCC